MGRKGHRKKQRDDEQQYCACSCECSEGFNQTVAGLVGLNQENGGRTEEDEFYGVEV